MRNVARNPVENVEVTSTNVEMPTALLETQTKQGELHPGKFAGNRSMSDGIQLATIFDTRWSRGEISYRQTPEWRPA